MASISEIKVGDRLDMQKGTMIYKGDGKADACIVGPDGKLVVKQADVTMTQQMVDAWLALKAKQAAYVGTHTGTIL